MQAIIVVGLGFGDEGKGATVDWLTRYYKAKLVVRYNGGSQAGHNVQLPDGTRHTFSQFGAGTLAGADTYLGPAVIINPPAMVREAEALRKLVEGDLWRKLTIDRRCLVTTPYHIAVNQAKEKKRDVRHGSCGHGIGETRSYWLTYGSDAITAADLIDVYHLCDKLELLRQRLLVAGGPCPGLELRVREVAERLMLPKYVIRPFSPYKYGTDVSIIFEGAQGVLLDEWHGFHPHTTWSTTTQRHALDLCDAWNIPDSKRKVLGVIRSYMTRHGNGPFPTEDSKPSDPGNPENEWQGVMRSGPLDLPLLRYAKACCGDRIDKLVVNHMDEYDTRICHTYSGGSTPQVLPVGQLSGLNNTWGPQYHDASKSTLLGMLAVYIAPVALVSYGPTWEHRELRGL